MKTLLRNRFIQFALLAIALFIVDGVVARLTPERAPIIFSAAKIEQLAILYAKEQRKPLDAVTQDELQGIIRLQAQEMALAREALKLGLDNNDTIITRRLAQKMKFMIEDTAPIATPKETVLKAWFDDNKNLFITPPQVSFRHIYLNPDKHNNLDDDAREILAQINQQPRAAWAKIGDAFLLKNTYQNMTPAQLDVEFGRSFAQSVFALTTSGENPSALFHGPIGSAYGLHLVQVLKTSRAKAAEFEDVRAQVTRRYMRHAQAQENRKAIARIVQKYDFQLAIGRP